MWMFVQSTHPVLSNGTFSNEILCCSLLFLIQNLAYFVCATTAKWILSLNHRNKKVVRDKHNVLVHYVNVCAPDPAGVVLWNPFKWDTLWFILIENLVIICVCAASVKFILFLNHRNKKVVEDQHNVLVPSVNVCAPDPAGVVLWNPFKWDTLLFHYYFWSKILLFLCACHKSIMHLFRNHMNRKVVGCQHNVLIYYVDASATGLFGVVLRNPFK